MREMHFVSFVIRISPHPELSGKVIEYLYGNKNITKFCSSWRI